MDYIKNSNDKLKTFKSSLERFKLFGDRCIAPTEDLTRCKNKCIGWLYTFNNGKVIYKHKLFFLLKDPSFIFYILYFKFLFYFNYRLIMYLAYSMAHSL